MAKEIQSRSVQQARVATADVRVAELERNIAHTVRDHVGDQISTAMDAADNRAKTVQIDLYINARGPDGEQFADLREISQKRGNSDAAVTNGLRELAGELRDGKQLDFDITRFSVDNLGSDGRAYMLTATVGWDGPQKPFSEIPKPRELDGYRGE
jgi:hypothetical protein